MDMNEVVTDDDVLTEILHRIPCLKSAIQCQSVCKRWRSLISSNFFQNRFCQRNQSNYDQITREQEFIVKCYNHHAVLMVPPPIDVFDFEFSLDFIGQEWFTAGSFNGLLLCAIGEYWHYQYMICNPITKQSVTLPPAPISDETRMERVFLGFVCDDSYRSFKVVRMVTPFDKITSELRVCVFSSETGQWSHSMVTTPTPIKWPQIPSPAVHHGGLLHWADIGWKYIVVYDIHNNKFLSVIHLPQDKYDPPQDGDGVFDGVVVQPMEGFGLCCGALCVAQVIIPGCILKIWQLNEQRKWSLKQKVRLEECITAFGAFWLLNLWSSTLIALHPYDFSIVYFGIEDGGILCCNLRTKSLKYAGQCNCHDSDERPEHHLYDWKETYSQCFPLWPPPVPQYNTSLAEFA
ncbi:F-box protein At5g49610-like [Mercurialis annua]|uniref:F-box protein At5g49610-like n=1 Tax=Mercurialis annua TaxID=3986 RepID=UPI002160FFAF|nr:F-box protein At5g49610-like [Mercurialis annua]